MTNATDDGCFGSAVAAWSDGIRSVTKANVTALARGEIVKLLAAFESHGPPVSKPTEREAWARSSAVRYARYAAGGETSVWGFARWLDAKMPAERGSGVQRVAPAIAPARLSKADRERIDRRADEVRGSASPVNLAEAFDAIGGNRPKAKETKAT